jgi:SAM-dependent methyltransferase
MFSAIKKVLGRSRLFAFNVFNRDSWIAQRAAELRQGARVLDVGAGSCPYRAHFAHCDYKTQDFQGLQDDQLRHGGYGQIDYICDAIAIPVASGRFDAVLCTEVIEHVPEPIKVAFEFGRLLRPGGVLILTAPLGSGIHQEPYHYYGGFTPYWYQRFLGEAGFVNIVVEPNAGFFRYYSQESLRFLQLSVPTKLPFPAAILWAPFWLLSFPLFALLIPVLSVLLDRFDVEQRFTVGYHVTAIRSGNSIQ